MTIPDSDIGVIRGFGTTLTDDDLFDCHQLLSGPARRTHVGGKELDRVLVSQDLQPLVNSVATRRDLAIRGDADEGAGVAYDLDDEEQDLSDQFPLVVTIDFPSGDGDVTSGPPAGDGVEGDIEQRLQAIESQIAELSAAITELREIVEGDE